MRVILVGKENKEGRRTHHLSSPEFSMFFRNEAQSTLPLSIVYDNQMEISREYQRSARGERERETTADDGGRCPSEKKPLTTDESDCVM